MFFPFYRNHASRSFLPVTSQNWCPAAGLGSFGGSAGAAGRSVLTGGSRNVGGREQVGGESRVWNLRSRGIKALRVFPKLLTERKGEKNMLSPFITASVVVLSLQGEVLHEPQRRFWLCYSNRLPLGRLTRPSCQTPAEES